MQDRKECSRRQGRIQGLCAKRHETVETFQTNRARNSEIQIMLIDFSCCVVSSCSTVGSHSTHHMPRFRLFSEATTSILPAVVVSRFLKAASVVSTILPAPSVESGTLLVRFSPPASQPAAVPTVGMGTFKTIAIGMLGLTSAQVVGISMYIGNPANPSGVMPADKRARRWT